MFLRRQSSFWFALALSLAGMPALAHTTKVAEDVAVMFHVEPDHNPKAGEPAQVWLLLTQQGGRVIPFEQCNCRLQVVPQSPGVSPIPEPTLKSMTAEQYRQVPGAEVVFPKPGRYTLEVTGSPQGGSNFQSFTVTYEVTVGAGRARLSPTPPPASPSVTAQATDPSASDPVTSQVPWQPSIVLAGLVFLGGAGGILWGLRRKKG